MWRVVRGRERLVIVFWVYCVLGGGIVIATPSILAERLYDRGFPVWSWVLMTCVQVLYLLWVHVSVWTCAFNSSRRLWGYAARAMSPSWSW